MNGWEEWCSLILPDVRLNRINDLISSPHITNLIGGREGNLILLYSYYSLCLWFFLLIHNSPLIITQNTWQLAISFRSVSLHDSLSCISFLHLFLASPSLFCCLPHIERERDDVLLSFCLCVPFPCVSLFLWPRSLLPFSFFLFSCLWVCLSAMNSFALCVSMQFV